MKDVEVMDVYRKIKEMSSRPFRDLPITPELLCRELDSSWQHITDYVIALQILEFIQLNNDGTIVLIK
jgi:hypothetical protein